MSGVVTKPMHDYRARHEGRPSDACHHLTQRCLALILAGGRGTRLKQLTAWRAKPAVPFAGNLKIIDFALSNCINSGLRRVAVLTQYKSQSLIRHVANGWGFLAANMGEYIDVVPAQQRLGDNWYSGTADAVYQNLNILKESNARYVLILAGDHVYKMDYSVMLADHVASGAAVSVACIDVPLEAAANFGVIVTDPNNRIIGFEEKPHQPQRYQNAPGRALASMGVYVFNATFLQAQLERDAADVNSGHDFGRDLFPYLVARHKVMAHHFADSCVNKVAGRPYWRDVGTVDSYWEANIELTKVEPELNLYDDQWPLVSLQPQLPPAKFVFDGDTRRGMAVDSLVSSGCIVSGSTIRRSILFAKVRVGDLSLVEDSVVLPDVVIGHHVTLKRVVVDKRCVLPDGFQAGLNIEEDRARFHVTEKGITLITQAMLDQLSGEDSGVADTSGGVSSFGPIE